MSDSVVPEKRKPVCSDLNNEVKKLRSLATIAERHLGMQQGNIINRLNRIIEVHEKTLDVQLSLTEQDVVHPYKQGRVRRGT